MGPKRAISLYFFEKWEVGDDDGGDQVRDTTVQPARAVTNGAMSPLVSSSSVAITAAAEAFASATLKVVEQQQKQNQQLLLDALNLNKTKHDDTTTTPIQLFNARAYYRDSSGKSALERLLDHIIHRHALERLECVLPPTVISRLLFRQYFRKHVSRRWSFVRRKTLGWLILVVGFQRRVTENGGASEALQGAVGGLRFSSLSESGGAAGALRGAVGGLRISLLREACLAASRFFLLIYLWKRPC